MQPSPAPELDHPLDPAFAYVPAGRLAPHGACDPHDAWRHLCSAVARDPLDLEAHARRVLLASQSDLPGRAFTALIDLFLALGARGRGLRESLLELAAPALAPDDRAFFEQHLEPGLSAGTGLPIGTHAVLDSGLMGTTGMIAHQRAQVAERTLAEQAADLVDQGDLAAARTLLEEGLMARPDDAAASAELLAIYRHSRDVDAERLMRERLTAAHGRTPAPWA